MAKERKYIYLERIMQRAPLRAKEGTYSWKIGNSTYGVSDAIERLLVYALYVGHPNYNFFELARLNLPKKVVNNTSPELLRSSFADDHPLIELIDYDYDMIPTYADEVQGLWLDGDGKKWSFWISATDERDMLSKLKSTNPLHECKAVLKASASRYGMNFDDKTIDSAVISFFLQHGIDAMKIFSKYNFVVPKVQVVQQQYHAQGNWYGRPNKSDERAGIAGVIGILLVLVIIGLWIAVFCKVELNVLVLPLFTICYNAASLVYIGECGEKQDSLGTFFLAFCLANIVTSIVAFIMASSVNMVFVAAMNLILPAICARRRGFGSA